MITPSPVVRAAVSRVAAGVLGLWVYMWPALTAPVVLWSDSTIDLAWVRAGILRSPDQVAAIGGRSLGHPLKLGYLVFLRLAMSAAPGLGETRSIVFVQSLLLWLSITLTCLYLGRHVRPQFGLVLYCLLVFLLRLRDVSSQIMSESISATLVLPLVTMVLCPPRAQIGLLAWGVVCGALFSVRPNLGLIVLCLALLALVKRARDLVNVGAGFAAVTVTVWMFAHAGGLGHPLRDLANPLYEASLSYNWRPSGSETVPRGPRDEVRARLSGAATNWRHFLAESGTDKRREIIWKGLHGLVGTEFYDPRWSSAYARFDTLTRIVAPFVTIAAVCIILTLPFPERRWNALAVTLIIALVVQNIFLGSLPRYVLPALPAVWLLGVLGFRALRTRSRLRKAMPALLMAFAILFFGRYRGALDWDGGQFEAAGVRIVQRIQRGSLPKNAPATLHIRVAPQLIPTGAHLTIKGPGELLLYTSTLDPVRDSPYITVPLPLRVLEENRKWSIDLMLISEGSYGSSYFLYFPVVPVPWGSPAKRLGGSELSPRTGVASGSFDWWAHSGSP